MQNNFFKTIKNYTMKKFITFLLFVGAFATSFAQYDPHQNPDSRNHRDDQYASSSNGQYDEHDHNNDHKDFDNRNFLPGRDRDFQIEKINRDYNFQIQSIQMDRYMRHHEKKVAIRNAERERERQIQMVNARFNGRFHDDHDRHYDDRQ